MSSSQQIFIQPKPEEKETKENSKKTIYAILLDADSCIFNSKYHHYRELHQGNSDDNDKLLEQNQALLDVASNKAMEYKVDHIEVRTFSMRQTDGLELFNAYTNSTSIFFLRLPEIANELKVRTNKSATVNLTSMYDIYSESELGAHFTDALKKYNQNNTGTEWNKKVGCKYTISHFYSHSRYDSFESDAPKYIGTNKDILLYLHCHEIATNHPEDAIISDCYDDLGSITNWLTYFENYSDLLPKNLSLIVNQYEDGTTPFCKKITNGTGIIDKNFRDTLILAHNIGNHSLLTKARHFKEFAILNNLPDPNSLTKKLLNRIKEQPNIGIEVKDFTADEWETFGNDSFLSNSVWISVALKSYQLEKHRKALKESIQEELDGLFKKFDQQNLNLVLQTLLLDNKSMYELLQICEDSSKNPFHVPRFRRKPSSTEATINLLLLTVNSLVPLSLFSCIAKLLTPFSVIKRESCLAHAKMLQKTLSEKKWDENELTNIKTALQESMFYRNLVSLVTNLNDNQLEADFICSVISERIQHKTTNVTTLSFFEKKEIKEISQQSTSVELQEQKDKNSYAL